MTAVVVAFDRSLSMPMNDLYFPALSRAQEIIASLGDPASPDHLVGIIEFGLRAEIVAGPGLSPGGWEYTYGTNLEAALRLAQPVLDGQPGRVVVVSDLFASAHTDERDEVVFSCPPAKGTLDRTVDAIVSCRHGSITIEALRFTSGETCIEEEPVVILDAIVAAGGTIEDNHVDDAFPSGEQPRHSWRYCA